VLLTLTERQGSLQGERNGINGRTWNVPLYISVP
jgi:hypothetical protein